MISIQPSSQSPPRIHGYTHVTRTFAGANRLFPTMTPTDCLATQWSLKKILKLDGPGAATVEIVRGGEKRKVTAYCKVTHVLDPIRSMQGYYAKEQKGGERRTRKVENPNNQAYVDAIACVALGSMREQNKSPHFCLIYDVFKGTADTYRWNITDEYDTYRNYKKFWEKRRAGYFTLYIERDDDSETTLSSGGRRLTHTPSSGDLHDREFSYKTEKQWDEMNSPVDLIEVESSIAEGEASAELSGENQGTELAPLDALEEVNSLGIRTESTAAEIGVDKASNSEYSISSAADYEIYSEFKQFPVMIFFQEHMEGTLDDLLLAEVEDDDDSDDENSDETDESSEEELSTDEENNFKNVSQVSCGDSATNQSEDDVPMEQRWIAWTFQIIAALSQMNGIFDMVHNDLHTNNIVYAETDQAYLYYKSASNQIFKVPTYGILLRIIDFGRSTYTIGSTPFCSDDFAAGGDAEGQYNYGEIYNSKRGDRIAPNLSFDLCRYASSVLEVLYPEAPEDREFGAVLNREPNGWEQKETVSDFFNLLWSWIVCDDGTNILRNEDGSERFTGFELYPQIAAHIHGARAWDQIHKAIFAPFQIPISELKGCEAVYFLYDDAAHRDGR